MGTQGGPTGNVGMYVGREMLASVPEDRRDDYLRLVEEISDLKYQLGVEVARQLPRLFAEQDDAAVERYLEQVRSIADVGWKSGVEVARQLPDLYHAPDPAIADAYVEIIADATQGEADDDETKAFAAEAEDLERQLREIEPKQQRLNELKSLLAARDRRDERRRKHAQELAAALPPILARLRPKHREVYMREVRLVAAADPEAALEAANTLLDLLNSERVSHDGAAEWTRRGLDVLEKNKEVGRGYFRMGSKYSLEVLEELREGLALRQVARVLKLYATALSGRDVAVRGVGEMDTVDRFGPDHIILPDDMRFFQDDDRNFTAYKVAAAHGAARIEFGTYRFQLDDVPETIEALIRATYPGIRRDMDLIQAQTLERRQELGADPADLPEVGQVVDAMMVSTMGVDPPTEHMSEHVREAAAGAIALMAQVEEPGATVGDTARVTAEIYGLIDDVMAAGRRGITDPFSDEAKQQQPRKPDEGEGEQDTGEVDFNPLEDYEPMEMPPFVPPVMEELVQPESTAENQIEAQGTEGDKDKEGNKGEDTEAASMEEADKVMQAQQAAPGEMDEDAAAQKAEGADEGEESGRGSDSEGEDEPDSAGGQTPEGAGPEVAQGDEGDAEEDLGEQTFMYDEWDFRIEDYRPSWCTLRETRSTREVPAFVAATFHEYGGVVTQIRRNFQLMRPERLRKMRFQADGDDLDLDGLVEHVVDRKARLTPTDRVYIKRDKKDRDVTTAFLVDMSSSTDRKIDGRKRIIDIEKEGLILMCEALEAIRDEYAIYGFSGNGRDDAQFYTVKELGERYDDRVRSRIGGIYGRSKTRMGPAIRHVTRRLMSVDSNVKIMIMLTDGKPYDSDTYQDNAYAQADTQMALREARREKIHLFCVTVDQEGAEYLPTMYSDANFVVIDDISTLPQKLPQLYRRLTT